MPQKRYKHKYVALPLLWGKSPISLKAGDPIFFSYGQNAASMDGVARFQAGQVGLEPTTARFGDECSAKLSYWPVLVWRSKSEVALIIRAMR
jgi:hypothetical protein